MILAIIDDDYDSTERLEIQLSALSSSQVLSQVVRIGDDYFFTNAISKFYFSFSFHIDNVNHFSVENRLSHIGFWSFLWLCQRPSLQRCSYYFLCPFFTWKSIVSNIGSLVDWNVNRIWIILFEFNFSSSSSR